MDTCPYGMDMHMRAYYGMDVDMRRRTLSSCRPAEPSDWCAYGVAMYMRRDSHANASGWSCACVVTSQTLKLEVVVNVIRACDADDRVDLE